MIGEIISIKEEESKNGGKFFLVNFKLEDGSFGQTFLVKSFRNYKKRWRKYLDEGNILANLKIKFVNKEGIKIIDADSRVFLFQGEKVKVVDLNNPSEFSKLCL